MTSSRRRSGKGRITGLSESRRANNVEFHYCGVCPDCGKRRYTSRKAAKRAMRLNHPGEQMSVYHCGDFFHYGHTPYPILRGFKARD